MEAKANILIVEDMESDCLLLENTVRNLGHIASSAANGARALRLIKAKPPDLILLDILMPVMSGFETLAALKKNPQFRDIPVIVISGLNDVDSISACILRGAEDFLIKPFNPTLLSARIRACLEKKQLLDQEKTLMTQIEDYNRRLEDMVKEKTLELNQAYEKLSILDHAKSDFIELISHELRTPLTGVIAAGQLLGKDDLTSESRTRLLHLFDLAGKKLLTIVEQAVLLSEIQTMSDQYRLETLEIGTAAATALDRAQLFAESRQVSIKTSRTENALVKANSNLLIRALTALLETAVKFTTENNRVEIKYYKSEGQVWIEIKGGGRNIPPEQLGRFFEVFSIADPITPGGDLGLGPPLVERIIKLMGGEVTAQNLPDPGVLFTIKLREYIPNTDIGWLG